MMVLPETPDRTHTAGIMRCCGV